MAKIKNDLIKLLLNLNIITTENENENIKKKDDEENNNFKKVGRNDKCPCGSGKKFKFCHGNI